MYQVGPIFGPNNHSSCEIQYRSVESHVRIKIASLLNMNFSRWADKVVSVKQLDGAEINSSNFQVQVINKLGIECKVLVRQHKVFDDESAGAVNDVAWMLYGHGCSVSKPLYSDQTKSVISHCGEIYSAYDFIEGDHFRGTEEEIIDVARGLGKFDRVLGNVTYDVQRLMSIREANLKTDDMFTFSPEIWKDILAVSLSRKQSGVVDWFDDFIVDYGNYFIECSERLSCVPTVPFQLVHSDLHPHNIITGHGKYLKAIVDLDSINYWERIRAISFAIHRLIRQYAVYTLKTTPSKEEIRRLRNVFLENYCEYNVLSSQEISSIRFFIEHEALKRAVYAAKDFYFRNNPAWKDGIIKHLISLHEAEYFGD